MKFYWFGDSWVVGDELEKIVPKQQVQENTFAFLVSDQFGADCVNLGQCGSSINSIPLAFSKVANYINPETDMVFFCLTAGSRTSMFNEYGEFCNILVNSYPSHKPHPHTSEWFKYFDNPHQRMYNRDSMINLLYMWCQHLNIKCYFLNLFTTESSDTAIVPESSWLVPQESCAAEFILNIIDNKYGSVIADDMPELTNEQWKEQSKLVGMYIRPCFAHPNVNGHKKIANELVTILNERFRI